VPLVSQAEARATVVVVALMRCALAIGPAAMIACHDPSPKEQATPATRAPATAGSTEASKTPPLPSTSASALSPEQRLALAPIVTTGESNPIDGEIAKAEEAVRHAPENVDLVVALGDLWVRKARESTDPAFYRNADACATIALDLRPDYAPAANLQTLVLLNDHKLEEARAKAEGIVAAHREDPMGYGNLSDALLELGRFDEAAAAVQKMVDLKPNVASYSRASYVSWLRGDSAGALEAARLAVDSGADPKDPEPRAWQLVQTAMIFWHRGDYDGADAGFELAREHGMSEYPPALVGKGRVALARGDGKRATELFERAYRHSPLVTTAWLLGDARTMAGDVEGAARAYALVERDGERTDKRALSLYYSTKQLKPDVALKLAADEKATRSDLYTDDAYAWALHRNGRDREARAAIDRALSHGTKDALLLFHAGAIRMTLHEVVTGKKLVTEALALNPKFDVTGAEEARGIAGADASR